MIVPALLLSHAVELWEAELAELRDRKDYPVSTHEIPVHELFVRFGAREWDTVQDKVIKQD